MKKIFNISILFFVIILGMFIIITSCSQPLIYKPGREWQFIVKRSDSPAVDTLILKIYSESWQITQNKIEYIYNKTKDSTGGFSQITEGTGVIDRQGNFFSCLFFKPEIWLHPPRSKYLRVTELLPFPWINFPIYIGQSNDWELTPKIGWGDFQGKTITGKIEVVNKIYYDNPIIKDSCWILNGFGNSEIGNYKCRYYFNEKYGFVYFFYDFINYNIEIIPIKITFKDSL